MIPILVDGAVMPAEQELPDDLKSLARRHGVELRHTRFNVDADAVVAALKGSLPQPRRRWIWPIAGAGIAAVCAGLALIVWPHFSTPVAPTHDTPKPLSAEARRKDRIDAFLKKSGKAPKSVAAVEGIAVGLGDTMDAVKAAYPSGSVMEGQIYLPLNGTRFIFDKDSQTLRTIRLEAPFSGSIQGMRIGDSLDNLLRTMGQPYAAPWDFAGSKAYAYNVGDTVVRFDVDKSDKIATIFYFPGSK
ncbi:MAG: hypothetical protein WDN31_08435 [Hyphomicrobium sp.]